MKFNHNILKSKNYLSVFILLTFLFSGCETVVQIDPPSYTPKLVVFSFNEVVNGQAKVVVLVSQTVGIFDETKNVKNATVTLEWENSIHKATFYDFEDLYFESDTICFKEDSEYTCSRKSFSFVNNVSDELYIFPIMDIPTNTPITLRVSAPGFETVTATQTLKPMVLLDTIEFLEEQVIDRFGDRVNALDFSFKDPLNIKNHYKFRLFGLSDFSEVLTFGVESVDVSTYAYDGNLLIDDEGFDGEIRKIRATFYSRSNGYIVQWSSIDESLFEYGKLVERFLELGDNPFSTPISLPSNINNGFGIFSLYTTQSFVVNQ